MAARRTTSRLAGNGTDILVTPPALALLWAHQLWLGLLVTFAPSIIVSAILLRWGRLERQRDSAFARYLARYMSPAAQAAGRR